MDPYQTLRELVEIDSPTGYTHKAEDYVVKILSSYGYEPQKSKKGGVSCNLGGKPKAVLAAHLDTLGGIVDEIKSDGSLKISSIGGYPASSFEGAYVRVRTLDDKVITGTLLINNPSSHASKDVGSRERRLSNMHIRLDELVSSADEVAELGVQVGDFVCFDPRYEETPSGFVKSRFMDNKAGCFALFEVARRCAEKGIEPPVQLYFSNYEEVGHGGTSGFATDIDELLVIDMAVVGEGISGGEASVSICVKDSTGPYDFRMKEKLVKLAEAGDIDYCLDVYPYYGSDGSAALRAGLDARVGLIGPGVSASHGPERTHKKGIEATVMLSMAYVQSFE